MDVLSTPYLTKVRIFFFFLIYFLYFFYYNIVRETLRVGASRWAIPQLKTFALPIPVYMKTFLRHRTLCPSLKGSMSDILLHFPDILDAISLNFRCFHQTLCPKF